MVARLELRIFAECVRDDQVEERETAEDDDLSIAREADHLLQLALLRLKLRGSAAGMHWARLIATTPAGGVIWWIHADGTVQGPMRQTA